jgi:hypothetical protein
VSFFLDCFVCRAEPLNQRGNSFVEVVSPSVG